MNGAPAIHSRPPDEAETYLARIARLHRELGIPEDYAARRGLPLCEEARELADIGPDLHGRPRQLAPRAARRWQAMRTRAEADSVTLLVVSAFRSVDYQRELIARKLAKNQELADILRIMAAPGYSEHHTGRALDLTAPDCPPLEEDFENTAAFHWLRQNAAAFHFRLSYPRGNPHGIAYEPWHWAYLEDS